MLDLWKHKLFSLTLRCFPSRVMVCCPLARQCAARISLEKDGENVISRWHRSGSRHRSQKMQFRIIHIVNSWTTPNGINNATFFNVKIVQLTNLQLTKVVSQFYKVFISRPVKYRDTGVRRDCVMTRLIWLVRNRSSHFPSTTHNTSTPQTFW